jgi:hypothetical protein
VKFTVHVSCPRPGMLDAQPCGGTHETEFPSRWKLCIVELSSSSSVYEPSGSVPPFSDCPFGSFRSIVWSSSTCAVSTGRSWFGMQNCPGGSVWRMRKTVGLPVWLET